MVDHPCTDDDDTWDNINQGKSDVFRLLITPAISFKFDFVLLLRNIQTALLTGSHACKLPVFWLLKLILNEILLRSLVSCLDD